MMQVHQQDAYLQYSQLTGRGGQLKLCVVPSLPYKPAVKR